jgi:integrase
VGSIINRDGRWRAQVRRKGHPAKCKTFKTKAQAEAWVRQTEADIDRGLTPAEVSRVTVAQVIQAYRNLRADARPISDESTEHYTLKKLEAGLGDKAAAMLTPDDLKSYAVMRRDEDGAGPYTINMDISKLGTVMRYGAAALKIALPDVVGAARPLLSHLRLIGGGGKRERRPTEDELTRVLAHLRTEFGPIYAEAVAFAAVSAMRRGEVCAITWDDIDQAKQCIGVWRKHPRLGKKWHLVPLLGPAWEIIQRQPKTDGRIFPIHDRTLSKYFTETCKALKIPDLHLHDMRHEGTSALFEEGYAIQQVALVTGHADWRHLRRYTQLKPEDLHKKD